MPRKPANRTNQTFSTTLEPITLATLKHLRQTSGQSYTALLRRAVVLLAAEAPSPVAPTPAPAAPEVKP